ncbi:MAG: hypothetical protein OXL96_15205 [Candidatus Poribacteria bacterium]|nr:hypothetical protein [Candidatus Poribacteria bacterium]
MPTHSPMPLEKCLAELKKDRCTLPAFVVEGSDDARIYTWVLQALGLSSYQVKIVKASTKGDLLQIYEAVDENRDSYADFPIVFIADLDMFLFEGVPSEYNGVVFTNGYSIENDLYSFANLEELLDPMSERENHKKVLDTIIEWFAFEIQEYQAGRYSKIARNLEEIVPEDGTTMDPEFLKYLRECRGFTSPCQAIHDEIKKDYKLKLRGKILFEILNRFLCHKNRKYKYSKIHLFEIAIRKPDDSTLKDKLIKKIRCKLNDEKQKLAACAPKKAPGRERLTIYANPHRIREDIPKWSEIQDRV